MLETILAIALIVLFYSIYFGKALLLRKKGIHTNQMAKGDKAPSVLRVEALLKLASYAIVPVQAVSIGLGWSLLPRPVRLVGAALALGGDLIFLASVITMKDSWRAGISEGEKTALVQTGIYSISRNPAFLGFDLMYLGLLFLFFNPLLCAFTLFAMGMLHLQILQEEKFLKQAFGPTYAQYQAHVLRYLGRK